MNIAIIGSGHIGAGLARAWAEKSHSLVFGARTVDDAELLALCKETHARATTIAAAPTDAEVVASAQALGTRDIAFKLLRR